MMKPASGFTLIETLVAIAVLTIAIVGPYTIAHTATVTSRVSQDELIASYLAQEGIEFVRAVRDDNFIARVQGQDPWRYWLSGVEDCSYYACTVDAVMRSVEACTSSSCAPLRLSDTGLYNHYTGTPTKFTRSVQVYEQPSHFTEAEIEVVVSWEDRGVSRSIRLEERIYDWLGTQ